MHRYALTMFLDLRELSHNQWLLRCAGGNQDKPIHTLTLNVAVPSMDAGIQHLVILGFWPVSTHQHENGTILKCD